jgi:DNA-directed RNA polymerase specialized sigma24 family protein
MVRCMPGIPADQVLAILTVLAATYCDNLTHNETAALLDCSPRKICYLLPAARSHLADILNRLDLL